MHRQHRGLGEDSLSVRSFLHSIRTLCEPEDDVVARHVGERVARLRRLSPAKVRDNIMFVSKVLADTKA